MKLAAPTDPRPAQRIFLVNALAVKLRQCGGVEFAGPRRYVSATSD